MGSKSCFSQLFESNINVLKHLMYQMVYLKTVSKKGNVVPVLN
jgi:hypothetical protein